MRCRNALIADGSPTLSACTGSNAVIYVLGAGAPAKNASMYMVKYLIRDSVEISASATVLADAAKHNRQHPSTSEDHDAPDRIAKYFAQRVLNSNMEMDATQAAGVVVGHSSSCHTARSQFLWPQEILRVAQACAEEGDTRNLDEQKDDEDQLPDDDGECDDEDDEVYESNAAKRAKPSHDAGDATALFDEVERALAMPSTPSERTASLEMDSIEMELIPAPGKAKQGLSRIFRDDEGNPIPVSDGETYAHRDVRLFPLVPHEFAQMFDVRPLTKADEEWHNEACKEAEAAEAAEVAPPLADRPIAAEEPKKAGRPRQPRFLLRDPHPLSTTHMLILKAKWGVPAFAGESPPQEPRVGRGPVSTTVRRQRNKYASWWMANFTPWDRDAPPDMSYKAWQAYRETLLQRATQYTLHETGKEKADRYVAHSRLSIIENVSDGLRVNEQTAKMLKAHRMRNRTLWGKDNPAPPCGSDTKATKEGAKVLKEIQNLALKSRNKASSQDLLNASQKAATWKNILVRSLPSQAFVARRTKPTDGEELAKSWPLAHTPQKKTLEPSDQDPKELLKKLHDNLPERAPLGGGDGVGGGGGNESGEGGGAGGGAYADITEDEYGRLASEWNAEKASAERKEQLFEEKPPLNPQQRAVTRDFLCVIKKVRELKDNHETPATWQQKLQEDGLGLAMLLMGAGGTGKSAVVHELDAKLKDMGTNLLVAAYTGVASAPFGGPTLSALFNLLGGEP